MVELDSEELDLELIRVIDDKRVGEKEGQLEWDLGSGSRCVARVARPRFQ